MKLKLLLVLILLLTSLSACRQKPIATPEGQIYSTSHSLTPEEVRNAIFDACADQKWLARDIAPGVVEARLVVRGKHTVVVDIEYDSTRYAIRYKSSENMKETEDGGIHRRYNTWVANLDRAITQRLSRLSR